ncbi:MAG: hypothetical protein R2880_16230 [Deinococcales bacterium]
MRAVAPSQVDNWTKKLKELSLLIKFSPQSILAFGIFRSPDDISHLKKALSSELAMPIVEQRFEHQVSSPLTILRELPSDKRHIIFSIYQGDLDKNLSSYAGFANIQREVLNDVPHVLLMFFRERALTDFIKQAPDFWAWRSAVLDFQSEAPLSLQEAWQAIESQEQPRITDREALEARAQGYKELIESYAYNQDRDDNYLGRTYFRLASTLEDLTEYEEP